MKLMTKLAATCLAFALVGPAMAANPMVGGAEMFENKNIIQNAVNSADHKTLVAAVQAAGLADTLMGAGPFTVFAPTDEAFAALPEGTVENLLKPENNDMLVKILTCHVVAGDIRTENLATAEDKTPIVLETLGGCKITLNETSAGQLTVGDPSGHAINVSIPDVRQSNGVIHVIDQVILPRM